MMIPRLNSTTITTRTIGAGYESVGIVTATGIAYRDRQTLVEVDGIETVRITGDRFDLRIDEPYMQPSGMPGYRRITDHGMPDDLTHDQAVQWWADALSLHLQEAA